MHHILVATDGSDSANRALDAAARIAKVTGSKLSILTVGGNLSGDEMRQLARAEKDIGAALDSMSERILIDARRRAEAIGAPDVATEVKWGDPAEAIIEAARAGQADTISSSVAGAADVLRACCSAVFLRRSRALRPAS